MLVSDCSITGVFTGGTHIFSYLHFAIQPILGRMYISMDMCYKSQNLFANLRELYFITISLCLFLFLEPYLLLFKFKPVSKIYLYILKNSCHLVLIKNSIAIAPCTNYYSLQVHYHTPQILSSRRTGALEEPFAFNGSSIKEVSVFLSI